MAVVFPTRGSAPYPGFRAGASAPSTASPTRTGALVIRPTLDVVADPGHAAAMTTAKDNVHWFAPRSPRAMTFDVIVDGLDRGTESYVIQPVDPLSGAALADGTIRAPLLSFAESSRRYTAAL